jgi:hypothetical protein
MAATGTSTRVEEQSHPIDETNIANTKILLEQASVFAPQLPLARRLPVIARAIKRFTNQFLKFLIRVDPYRLRLAGYYDDYVNVMVFVAHSSPPASE